MIEIIPEQERVSRILGAGLPESAVLAFVRDLDSPRVDAGGTSPRAATLGRDSQRVGLTCRQGRDLLTLLPPKSRRNAAEKIAGHALVHLLADTVWRFFRAYRNPIYDALTEGRRRTLRVEDLAWRAAELLPHVMPSRTDLARESQSMQMDKDGMEIHQGLFFAQMLSDADIGRHLCMAMLKPLPEAIERLPEFTTKGAVNLGLVRVAAKGDAGYLYFCNTRTLNAEDDDSLLAQEIACDLILLHPGLRMGVLRGGPVEHAKHKDRRVFSAGINLTRIYQGKQSYLFYLTRDMGLVNKLYRGLVPVNRDGTLDIHPDEPESTLEKPWLGVVDAFAIGGGCQLLLVMDYVIAESGAYLSLPARKEGIIPGCANLRLPRFTGERLAREAIMFDKTFRVDEQEARTLVNEVHERDALDAAVERCVANAVDSGMVSAGGNRKAVRVQSEPLDTFRCYMAAYAYEQAFCHVSEQLAYNLERHWIARQRRSSAAQ